MDKIKDLALRMAREKGLINLTCADVSHEAGFPEGSFSARAGYSFTEMVTKLTPLLRDMPHHTQTINRRAHPAVRRDQIIKAALEAAKSQPYNKIRYREVAERAGVSRTLISRYFLRESDLIEEVLKLAIEQDVLQVVKLGLLLKHPVIMAAPSELRERANTI